MSSAFHLEGDGNDSPVKLTITLSPYDSIYITNNKNDILKVYKENSEGKNIYNIDEFWNIRESSENYFVYTYEITEEDLE